MFYKKIGNNEYLCFIYVSFGKYGNQFDCVIRHGSENLIGTKEVARNEDVITNNFNLEEDMHLIKEYINH